MVQDFLPVLLSVYKGESASKVPRFNFEVPLLYHDLGPDPWSVVGTLRLS